MDKNTLTGLVLISAIMIGYFVWMQPSEAERLRLQEQQDSIAAAEADKERLERERSARFEQEEGAAISETEVPMDSLSQAKADSLRKVEASERYGTFAAAANGEEQFHTLENENLKVTLSSLGAAPIQAQLVQYQTFDSLPLYLFDKETSAFDVSFWINRSQELHSSDFYFEPVRDEMSSSEAAYRLYGASRSEYIEISYSLNEGDYMLQTEISVQNMDRVLDASEELFQLSWEAQGIVKERSREKEMESTTAYYKYFDESSDNLSLTDYESEKMEASVQWVSFKQQFFSTAIISEKGFDRTGAEVEILEVEDEKYTKGFATNLGIDFGRTDNPSFPFSFYLGPNHFQTLNDYDIGLEEQIDLGWYIFAWVNRWLVIPLFNFLDQNTGLSYGIIILILTLVIKMILFPLTWRNYVSSARMKVLRPEIEEINKKFEDKDAMQKQQATMALYRKAGVNPMAGCIPMLLQFPILLALFRFFPSSIELRQESFLWAVDLSTYDSIFTLPFEIPFYGDHVSLFTILMAISTFLYSKYNMDMSAGAGGPQMAQMKIMIYFMPIMLLFFFNGYSSGLSYYYFTANIISVAQQFVIKRYFIDEEAIHKKIQENKKKPVKKSGFQQRLEKMAKERGYQQPQQPKRKKK